MRIQKNPKLVFVLVLILGLFIKLYLAFNYNTADTGAMNFTTDLLLSGERVYSHPQVHFSPPPLQLHVITVLKVISNKTGISFLGLWKLPTILADTGVAILIFLITKDYFKQKITTASKLGSLYALNPISWYVSGFHGQTEAVWLFLVLLAWYFFKLKKQFVFSALLAGLAVSYKLPAALLLPGLVWLNKSWNKKIIYGLIIFLVFIISFLPELFLTPASLFRQVISYDSLSGIWGLTNILTKLYQPKEALLILPLAVTWLKRIMLLVLALFFWRSQLKKEDFFKLSLGVLVIFFIFTPGFSVQFLLMPLPFLILLKSKWYKMYTALVVFAFLHTYGIDFFLLSWPITFLQRIFYYKTNLIYPYDIYFPIWILFSIIGWQLLKNNQKKEHV